MCRVDRAHGQGRLESMPPASPGVLRTVLLCVTRREALRGSGEPLNSGWKFGLRAESGGRLEACTPAGRDPYGREQVPSLAVPRSFRRGRGP